MPFIFPKRFLRSRDILDPAEFNQDTEPVQELLDGELDRHNFNATDLKANVFRHESLIDTSDYNAAVGESAYYDVYSTAVECSTIFEHGKAKVSPVINTDRKTPNFVKPDGGTFRDSRAGSDADGYPSIVPNTGAWSAVKDGDLTDAMKLTVTTGQASLYINAYVQYVWQGFYEYKKPWAYEGPSEDTTNYGWAGTYGPDLATAEQASLNLYGPDSEYLAWAFEDHRNPAISGYDYALGDFLDADYGFDTTMVPQQYDASYAFALNEIQADDEARTPQLGGYHHISRGFLPALVQFAIRIDGKVVDSTITGKSFSFEESAHGLRVDDSPKFELGGDSDGYEKYVFGQRSAGQAMNYDADRAGRPGQKIRSSRASACGPEVLPIRLGGVIPVSPGTHTIEIVARRLLRKRQKFEYGDFVGVFSRRLSVMSLPIYAPQLDSELVASPVVTKSLQSEDLISVGQESYKLTTLENRVNSLQPSDIKRRSLPNTHLPSKVKFWQSTGIDPDFSVGRYRECLSSTVIKSRFPGFKNTTYLDKVTSKNSSWFRDYEDTLSDGSWGGAGWQKLYDEDRELSIASTSSLKITEDEKVIIFADIEVRGLHPVLQGNVQSLIKAVESETMSATKANWKIANYIGFSQADKYLDLFALFNIGYRTGSDPKANWIIGSKHAPATINSSAWANRKEQYVSQFAKGSSFITGAGDSSHDYGLTVPKIPVDTRGNATAPNNLGITIPLMLTLDYSDFASAALAEITEIAVFGCTTFPSDWDEDEGTGGDIVDDVRTIGDHVIKNGSPLTGDDVYYWEGADKIQNNQWASPHGGRKLLGGLRAHIGRCRLTVMKVYK